MSRIKRSLGVVLSLVMVLSTILTTNNIAIYAYAKTSDSIFLKKNNVDVSTYNEEVSKNATEPMIEDKTTEPEKKNGAEEFGISEVLSETGEVTKEPGVTETPGGFENGEVTTGPGVTEAPEGMEAGEVISGAGVTEGESEATLESPTPSAVASTAELRLIYTTDIHGQVTNYDYQNSQYVSRGLNKVYTLIKKAREEKPEQYLTMDIGDAMVDYTSEYIHAQSETVLQPVYRAMNKIGYDAITVGNHEFDFGYDYLMEQLEESGMIEKSIVSNVVSKVNGDYILGKQRHIIEKTVKDSSGNERVLKIGLLGVTPPCMSSKNEKLKNYVASEDMLVAAKREAKALKEEGADIVVALAHTGFGTENPANRNSNTGYAMTKIEDIDVILGGHQHVYFPNSSDQKFYSYPNVDKETSLVNGKRFMILKNGASAIGVVDLQFEIGEDGKVVYTGSNCEIRKTSSNTEADKEITQCLEEWDAKLREYTQNYIGKLDENERWTNYAGLLEDNEIVQVAQNAQMEYAANTIEQKAPQYSGWPIISMVRYTKYGYASGTDYADLKDNLYLGNVANFAPYNSHIYIYNVTGKQLKEWLEWGASTYETINSSAGKKWTDMTVADYIEKEQGNVLIQSQYQNNWDRLFMFNGIEYVIDPTEEPRYNEAGDKINDTQRVVSMTYNGVPIADDQRFALCTEQIIVALDTEATRGIKSSVIYGAYDTLQDAVCDYLRGKTNVGDIEVNVDNNWYVKLPNGYPFIYTAGKDSQEIIEKKSWYERFLSMSGDFRYYACKYQAQAYQEDKTGPNIVVSSLQKEDTNESVNYRVMCNDVSGISKKVYIKGKYTASDTIWTTTDSAIKEVENDIMCVTGSGVYTVFAVDGKGNKTAETFAVTNIYPSNLMSPKIDALTNKTVYINGTADPTATVYVKLGEKVYKSKVEIDGAFRVKIPRQNANTTAIIYATDKYGRESKRKSYTVKRTGPNAPTIATIKNNGTSVSGKCNDKNVKIYLVMNGNAYVSKSLGESYYKKSKGYDKKLAIKKTNITIKANGEYKVTIPNQYAGVEVVVYSVDKLGRVSGGRNAKVAQTAPNRVNIKQCTSGETYVYGNIPNGGKCTVAVKKGEGNTYYGSADQNGNYAVKVGKMTVGTVMKVRAKGSNGNYSYAVTTQVKDFNEVFLEYNDQTLMLNKITNKSSEIKGISEEGNAKIYIYAIDKCYVSSVDSDGNYKVKINKKQPLDQYVYAVCRKSNGRLVSMCRKKVSLAKPEAPTITTKLKEQATKIAVEVKEDCEVYLMVNKKKYTSYKKKCLEDNKTYRYTFTVNKLKEKQELVAYSKNAAGTVSSKKLVVPKTVKKETEAKKTTNKKK